MAKREKGIKFVCDLCGGLLEEGRPRFIIRGELFCAFDGLEIEDDMDRSSESIREEMKRLIQKLEKRSEEEVRDEVHFPFKADLCRSCRDKFYVLLKPALDTDTRG